MKIALAQINPTVGKIEENVQKILEWIKRAREEQNDLVIFPELSLTGYPPKDLLLKKMFIKRNKELLQKIVEASKDIAVIIGFVDEKEGMLANAAAVIHNKRILHVYHKINLPNYDVFDEKRYFTAGSFDQDNCKVIEIGELKIGVNVCEDIWVDNGPYQIQTQQGADYIINISASPFHYGKSKNREELLSRRAQENKVSLIYCNLIGAQDDLIFDGKSYIFNNEGQMIAKASSFKEDLLVIDTKQNHQYLPSANTTIAEVHDALILGISDYFRKNSFTKAILGLSGGIDSALTAALAVEALGKENVMGITMPSSFSSLGSIKDSEHLAQNLGINCHIIPIKDLFATYITSLEPHFQGVPVNVAEENIQARIRGNILMAIANKFGYLVLATGNKSELSVGYATLYGDMAGGLAVISDVLKTTVYELCEFINKKEGKELIPPVIITKEPSAELREGQKDSDSLPPYNILDPILQAYVEEDKDFDEIIAMGFDKETVSKVMSLVDRCEYKRQQAALGLRITPRAFGSGRRMPITNGWKE